MKPKKLIFLILFISCGLVQAQTADEIISKYFENTGGLEKWKTVRRTHTRERKGMHRARTRRGDREREYFA